MHLVPPFLPTSSSSSFSSSLVRFFYFSDLLSRHLFFPCPSSFLSSLPSSLPSFLPLHSSFLLPLYLSSSLYVSSHACSTLIVFLPTLSISFFLPSLLPSLDVTLLLYPLSSSLSLTPTFSPSSLILTSLSLSPRSPDLQTAHR